MNEFRFFAELLWTALANPRTGVLLVLLVGAVCTDIRSYRIPNWLTGGGLVCGLALSMWQAPSPAYALMLAFAGAAAGMAALLPLYALRMLGAGDVKLVAMGGSFLALPGTLYALLFVLVSAGVIALLYGVARRSAGRLVANAQRMVLTFAMGAVLRVRPAGSNDFTSVGRMPYSIGVFVGMTAYVLARQAGWLA